jgi:hypothetical protein
MTTIDSKKAHVSAKKNAQVIKEAVSGKLKAYYDDITRQEVPKRFLDLLQELDEATEKQR